ncbi:MAG TPA: zinc ribbon domain-containing protein [Vicinamibacterales bacterium]|nr:zinc ribbon domain-containing protein [Vicinamibacterales bacterium]
MSSAISTDPGLRPWQLFLLAGMLAATAVVLVSTGRPTSSVVVLSVTVVAASLVAVASYRSLAPLVAPEDLVPDAPAGGRTRAALEREKALVLRSIKELEFDHAMRKTAVGDYEEMRDRLKLRAVGLLRQLDHAGYREAVERDLAAREGAAARPPVAPGTATAIAPTESAVDPAAGSRVCAACGSTQAGDARFCTGCGTAVMPTCAACHTTNEPDARFCKACGVALTGTA